MEQKRSQQQKILSEVTGKAEQAAAFDIELSLDQKEAQAEKTFNAILERVMAREKLSDDSPRYN